MIVSLLVAAIAPPTASAAALGLQQVKLRARGSGELTLAHRYPIGALTYTADRSGRGLLAFDMGKGILVLTGPDADQSGPGAYTLHLDVMQVGSLQRVNGDCALAMSDDQREFRSLECSGRVLATRETFTLSWRGAGEPAVQVR